MKRLLSVLGLKGKGSNEAKSSTSRSTPKSQSIPDSYEFTYNLTQNDVLALEHMVETMSSQVGFLQPIDSMLSIPGQIGFGKKFTGNVNGKWSEIVEVRCSQMTEGTYEIVVRRYNRDRLGDKLFTALRTAIPQAAERMRSMRK